MALKDIPQTFQPDDEEEVRVAVAQFFRELGFEPDEMSFEDKFVIKLGHTSLELGVTPERKQNKSRQRTRIAGRSDLLLARNGQPLAIVETKAPDHVLTDDDAWQALSYARLLLSMAPFAIVTNGKETQVYDTFASALQKLEVPTGSLWYEKGQQMLALSDEVKYQAAQKLIGINAQTLYLFCQRQVANALVDLKGTMYEAKPYLPEVYFSRQTAEEQLTAWLSTDLPCFAVVGDSGVGKTTFMCAAAEKLLAEGYFVLFYSASNLEEDLKAAICNDFIWEFHRERGLAFIVGRFDEIARKHGKKLLLFLDALDRFPGKREKLKAELLALVPRLRDRSIRLCLSCKSFDWEGFVIDNARSYNKLATSIYPPLQRTQTVAQPDASNVGFWLYSFTREELNQVFPKYQHLFSLRGSLQGMVRVACQHPLILRLLAEAWSRRDEPLPKEISQLELFEAYWKMKMSEVRHRLEAEQWLSEVAKISVESGKRQVGLEELRVRLPSLGHQDETYQDLVRLGLLNVSTDKYGHSMISFGLDTLRAYVYALKAQIWPKKIEDGKSKEVAALMSELLEHPVGVEVVEFYVRTIDRGKNRFLTDIALHDIFKFVQLLDIINARSFVFAATTSNEQRQGFISYLTQFVIAYSDLLHRYFPDLCERIEPYIKGEVGLWISGSTSSTMYQFRERTQARSEPLIIIPPEVASALSKQQASPEIYSQIRPGGRVYLDLRGLGLVEQLPQKMAWNRILSQVADLLDKRCLDESITSCLLQERIWHILTNEPALFVEGVPVTGVFREVLGFQTLEEIQAIPIEEVIERTQELIEQYMAQYVGLIQQHGLNAFANAEPAWSRWYVINIRKLRRLDYSLRHLQHRQTYLELPTRRSTGIFDYVRTGDLQPTVEMVQQLLPSILQSYVALVQKNVSVFADELALFRHSNASLIVEVTRRRSFPMFQNDFLTLTYIILPSTKLLDKYMVYTCQEKDSLMHIPLRRKTPQGHWTEISGTQGATFGQGEVLRQIGGSYIHESNAFFYFTRFPSQYPILDQVYQLLGNELYVLLNGDVSDWHKIEIGSIDHKMLDMLIDLQSGRIRA